MKNNHFPGPIVAVLVFLPALIICSCQKQKDIFIPAGIKLIRYGEEGQTSIYRADISKISDKNRKTIVIQDSATSGGSDGIYTGFDIDFVLLDIDGDFRTKNDQFTPYEDARTQVTPGAVLNRTTSLFVPTSRRPGKLFGLDSENKIDFRLVTLSGRDAQYDQSINPDKSSGWLSLGKRGILYVRFDMKNIDRYSSLYLFIGETGTGFEEDLDLEVKLVD